MNKKFDRVLQWGKEKMGNDQKTSVSEDFQAMETEMQMRHQGMEKLHISAQTYVKSLSKRREGDDKEKIMPVDIAAQSMIAHGNEFEPDSTYGQCLSSFGHANESIARIQEAYVGSINDTWLLSLERSLAQMKEYQNARKKLESRRLAYDTTLSKMQKQKKEDFRVEEELRSQRIKYEESMEDVTRRMTDVQDAEADTLEDLSAFLEAELEYYEKCRNILLKVKDKWPAPVAGSKQHSLAKTRSRSNTARSYSGFKKDDPEEAPPPLPTDRPTIRSRVASNNVSGSEYDQVERTLTPDREYQRPTQDREYQRPSFNRVNSASRYEDNHSPAPNRMHRTGTEVLPPPSNARTLLRPVTASHPRIDTDCFGDDHATHHNGHSPERHYADQLSTSPSGSAGSGPRLGSRVNSISNFSNPSQTSLTGSSRKPPPPPAPASRIGKKAPPPPPMKRAALSMNNIHG